MTENSRLYPYVVPGYTGHIPSGEEGEGGEFEIGSHNHIPGYMGYIPHVKPENMFGKTYGKITHLSKTGNVNLGNYIPAEKRFQSTVKESFTNQREIFGTEEHLTNLPKNVTVQGTREANFDPNHITEHKKTPVKLTYEELREILALKEKHN